MTAIDISQLPAPDFLAQIDYETEVADLSNGLVAMFEGEAKDQLIETLSRDSEPMTKLIQMVAYRSMIRRQEFNDRCRSLLLAYASGSALDHIGATYYATPRLSEESDAAYLERLLLAPDRHSTAGAARSYKYHARSASSDVLDVTAENAGAGVVRITVLSAQGNGTASVGLIQTVSNALSPEDVRPLTDTVLVESAAIRTYEIKAVITPASGPDPALVLADSIQRAQVYAARRHRIGLSVVRDAVLAALWTDQVENVVLTEPSADLPAIAGNACFCTLVEVTS